MIKCSFCGHSFEETESKACCEGCPMSRSCKKLKCPNCGFEILREPAVIKMIKRRLGK